METSFNDLRDQSVFITGGGSGIGAALSEGFIKAGARVAFIGRSDASRFCDSLEARYGRRPLFIQGDIRQTERLREAMDSAARQHGGLQVLVNNAADDQRHLPEAVDEAYWEQSMAVNLKAYFFACQRAADYMKRQGGGSIINLSSISYMMGQAGYPLYAIANSGINGMTRVLAREWGGQHIRVNALAPGWVMTQKQRDLWVSEAALEEHLARQCLPDPLEPEDLVGATLFLASTLSKAMTGQALVVDGGVVVTG